MLSPVTAITAGVVVFALGWRVLRCPIQLTVLNDDRHVRRNDHPHGVSFMTVMNVWDNPEAIADFFIERTRPIIEEMGDPPDKPERHGEPGRGLHPQLACLRTHADGAGHAGAVVGAVAVGIVR